MVAHVGANIYLRRPRSFGQRSRVAEGAAIEPLILVGWVGSAIPDVGLLRLKRQAQPEAERHFFDRIGRDRQPNVRSDLARCRGVAVTQVGRVPAGEESFGSILNCKDGIASDAVAVDPTERVALRTVDLGVTT